MQYRLTPDLQSALTDKFTDSAIAMNSKVNGEHKEKVLQRWEGGDSNSDDYDLESDMVQSPFWRTLELGGSAAEVWVVDSDIILGAKSCWGGQGRSLLLLPVDGSQIPMDRYRTYSNRNNLFFYHQ